MLNFEAVAILHRPLAGFDPGTLLPTHLDFMVELEKEGLLLLSGPLTTEDGKFGHFGLTVLNVATIAEARAIWADEPFYHAGQRDADFFIWRLMEGRLNVSLDLSDRSFRMGREDNTNSP